MDYKEHNTTKVHVWVGLNYDKDYYDYFELDYNLDVNIDDPEYKVCGFCKDVDKRWYDEDWLGSFQHTKPIDLNKLLKELSITKDVMREIKSACLEKGFKKANAMFWYYDADLKVKDKEKVYNKLSYVGMFDTELGNWQ